MKGRFEIAVERTFETARRRMTVRAEPGGVVLPDGTRVPAIVPDGAQGRDVTLGIRPEHLEGGDKVLEVREAPAAAVLMLAYRTLETAVLDAELIREKIALEQLWVREAIEGRWFSPLKTSIEAFISQTAKAINGKVALKLSPGSAQLASIRASAALYLTDRDSWEKEIARERSSRSLAEIHGSRPPQALRQLQGVAQ